MDVVEDVIADFRPFQTEARQFFTRHQTLEQEREKKMDRRIAIAGVGAALLLVLVGWLTWRDAHRPTSSQVNHPIAVTAGDTQSDPKVGP